MGWSALLLLAACGGGDDTDGGDAAVASLVGAWEVVEDLGAFQDLGVRGARFLDVHADGTVTAHQESEAGLHACPTGGWVAFGEDALALYGDSSSTVSLLLLVAREEGGGLVLRDASGATVRLARVDEVPEDARCRDASLGGLVPVASPILYGSNLLFDGADLRLTTEDGTFAIDPTTGALSDPWTFGWESFRVPLAWEGGAPWNGCGCGGLDVLRHVEPDGDVLDEVVTGDVGGRLEIRGAAHDGTNLWLLGEDDDGRGHLRAIATAPEPDVLVSDVATTLDARALAFHQGELYLLTDRALARVDRSTARVAEDWSLPDDRRWHALGSDGDRLWIVDLDEESVLTSVTSP